MNLKFFSVFYIKGLILAICFIAIFFFTGTQDSYSVKAAFSCPSERPYEASNIDTYLVCCADSKGNDCKGYNKNEPSQNQSSSTNSANLKVASEEEIDAIARALESDNNSCPEPIKQRYLDIINSGGALYANGTTIVAYEGGDQSKPIVMTCASASTLNKLVIRGIMILFSLVGLALAFAVGRASILMITSFANPDQYETGVKSLVTSVIYTVGVIFFYSIFIFVAVNVLGIGAGTTRKEFNLFCSNQIIINITFDQNGNC